MNKQSEQSISAAHYEEFKRLVAQMRKAQRQWQGADPFDGETMKLAEKLWRCEKQVDQWLEENL